jgi:hypothetical protein
MYSVKLVRLALPLLAAAAIVAGCGDDAEEPAEEPALNQIAAFIAPDAPVISFVDFGQARDQLGLPADADPLDFEALKDEDLNDPSPEAQLVGDAVIGMPSLTSFVITLDEDPASAEFDGSQITAAASTISDGFPMTVIQTTQPFSEISDGLTELGYTADADGTTLTKEGERFEQVADGGDGIIVIANNGAAADAIANKGDGPTELVDLLEPADQPIQAVGTGVPSNCITVLGGWENADTTEGVLRFQFDSEPSAENFDTAVLDKSLDITTEEPTIDGDTAEIPFTGEAGPPGSRVRVLLTRFVTGYDCG